MRLIGKCRPLRRTPTGTAWATPYIYPDNDLSYAENFMNMLWKDGGAQVPGQSRPGARARHPVHPDADHEQNAAPMPCARWAVRLQIRTSPPLPAAAALSGPLHGGANEEVLKMLDVIGSKDNIPAYIEKVQGRPSSS